MSNVPALRGAQRSPRIHNGNILFYEGDTFRLMLTMEIDEADGSRYHFQEGDSIELEIYDRNGDRVWSKQYTDCTGGRIALEVNADLNAVLPAGKYHLAARFRGENATTIIAQTKIIVEGRHDVW